jgi:predicted transcriptional regulator
MNLYEITLFKLCQKKIITIEQAKILNTIRQKKACTKHTLSTETGIPKNQIETELTKLEKLKIINQTAEIYYCHNLLEKITELIDKEKEIIIKIKN